MERLYSQRVPGWCSSGSAASAADCSAFVCRSRATLRLHVGLVHRGVAAELIGQAGGVAHQVLHGDRPLRGLGLHGAVAEHCHLRGSEFREVLADWIAQQQAPFLPQHHHRHRHQGLGHRVDAEDRVGLHRRAAVRVAHAKRLVECHLAVPGNQRHGTGNVAAVHPVCSAAPRRRRASGASPTFSGWAGGK